MLTTLPAPLTPGARVLFPTPDGDRYGIVTRGPWGRTGDLVTLRDTDGRTFVRTTDLVCRLG